MKLSGKNTDRMTQLFALMILLGIVAAFISTVSDGSFSILTRKEDYKNIYAYTDENSEQ